MRSGCGSVNSEDQAVECKDEHEDRPCSSPELGQRASEQTPGLTTSEQIPSPLMLRLSNPLIRSPQTSLLLQQFSSEEMGKQLMQLTSVAPAVTQSRPSVLRQPPHPLHPQQDQPRWRSDPYSEETSHPGRQYLMALMGQSSQSTSQTDQSCTPSQHRKSRSRTHHEHCQSPEPYSLLYANGHCRWPGCEERCQEYTDFLRHLDSEHTFDAEGTVQWNLQRDLVQRMENQLMLEKQKLHEMACHLNTPDQKSEISPGQSSASSASSVLLSRASLAEGVGRSEGAYGAHASASEEPVERGLPKLWHAPLPQHLLPDMIHSFDVYKYTNIRPPYTYACLIRWSIVEAPERQRTLNEIYNWFMQMFCYFRHNNSAWKVFIASAD
ncbi:forkhead box protein P3 isoform X2 [Engraulis encrasicolus]|uniref:forkhead box protein P3 isoform X2 n=1 Tax=Engraulis encrasicolus TaxID=184585 RepID=UPI002FCFB07C